MMTARCKGEKAYTFQWEDLGDLAKGRPNLGSTTPVLCYRLLQYTFKDVLSKTFGRERTRALFVQAGHLAGTHFCRNMLNPSLDFDAFVSDLTEKLETFRIGILRIETMDAERLRLTLTMSEDLDCSGLPIYGETVCDYDEGFLAGIWEVFMGMPYRVKEVDCWATGDRTCRFTMEPAAEPPAP